MPKKPKKRTYRGPAPMLPEGRTVAVRPTDTPRELIDLVRDPQVDPAKLKALLDMKNEQRQQEAKDAYAVAMSDAQSKMEPVRKDCENRQTHSKYASYTALDRAIRQHYVNAGFALEYNTEAMSSSEIMRITCDVSHKAGYTKHFQIDMPIVTKGPQGSDVMTATHATMSALTYGKRGLLKSIFNITEAGEDDDGNAAGTITITEKQVQSVREKIKEVGGDETKICEFLGIDRLEQMPAMRLGQVLLSLADRERLRKAEKQPA